MEKQTVVYGRHQKQKSVLRATDLSLTGRLWNDDDFKFCKMGEKCQPLLYAFQSMKTCDDHEEIFLSLGRKVEILILLNLGGIQYWRPGYVGYM